MLKNTTVNSGRAIRVVIYSPRMAKAVGGAEHVMLTLLHNLRRDRFEPILVVRQGDGEWFDRVPADVAVHVLDTRVRFGWFRLARALRELDPDVVLSMSSSGNLTACLGHWFGRVRCPLVVSERNNFSQAWNSSRWKFGLMRLTKGLLYRRARAVIAVSKGVAEDLAESTRIPIRKIIVVYNPIVGDTFVTNAEEPITHPWFDEGIPVVLSVARLAEQKDFPMLLEAFRQVRLEREARLLILGDGNLRSELETLADELGIGKDVSFFGWVDNPAPYMKRCAVFALSSRYEGLPGALIQAMACGAPVVSTDCPSGPGEIITHEENGLLVRVGDSQEMAEAIKRLLDDSNLRTKICRHGQARAAWFSVDRAVSRFEGILIDMAGSRKESVDRVPARIPEVTGQNRATTVGVK